MLSGEKRGLSARRGMTVLGKIPAVPKPINLPSQRLENRGLDPNVELVPRGTVSWGSSGRSPPTSGSPWGNTAQSSSPPVSTGAWGGAATKVATGSRSNTSAGGWPGNPTRPSSAGSGTRPSSAGSGGQSREQSVNANAWGLPASRPSSASGVLGHAQSLPMIARPRSAETRPGNSQSSTLSRFADPTNEPATPFVQAWGPSAVSTKLQGEQPQASRFILTPVDFPTLGSEKNPDLRPQQTNTSSGRPVSADGTRFLQKERQSPPPEAPYGHTSSGRPASADGTRSSEKKRQLPPPQGPYEDLPPTPMGVYGGKARAVPDTWRRENPPFAGPSIHDGHWHRGGSNMHSFVSVPAPPDTWRREDSGYGPTPVVNVTDDTWRRGASPVGPYGPGRFSNVPFLHQRFGPGAMPYRRGAPGSGGYGRQSDLYGPFVRQAGLVPGRAGVPLGPGMYPGPMQYEGYYGPVGPAPYGSMEEKEMMMLGMVGPGPGMYGNSPHHSGPPHEHFNRLVYSGQGTGPRHPHLHSGGARGYEGDTYSEISHKDLEKPKDAGRSKEGGNFKDGGLSAAMHDRGKVGSEVAVPTIGFVTDVQKHKHRDWGSAASNGDEPMDFSKPAFGEDLSSAPPKSEVLDVSGVLPKEGKTVTNKIILLQSSTHASSDHLLNKQNKCVEESTRSQGKFNIQLSSSAMSCKTLYANDEASEFRKETQGEGEAMGNCEILKEVLVVSRGKVTEDVPSQDAGMETASQETLVDNHKGGEMAMCSATDSSGEKVEDVFSGPVTTPFIPKTLQQTPGKVAATSYFPSLAGSGSTIETTASNTATGSSSATPTCVFNTKTVLPSVVKATIVLQPGGKSSSQNFETEGLMSKDKLVLSKRNGEAHSDIAHTGGRAVEHGAHIDIIKDSTLTQEPSSTDDHKSKSRFHIHEGEMEWRPKASTSQSRTEAAKVTGTNACKASSAAPMVMTTTELKSTSEKGAMKSNSGTGVLESENLQQLDNLHQVDSYDYEAQRARLKEIAAQRSRQLQKEEEERIKEQRAKALAKLEELNRRTSVPSNIGDVTLCQESIIDSTTDELATEEQMVSLSASQHETVPDEPLTGLNGVVEENGGSENNDHGKHGRDCKRLYVNKEELRPRGSTGEYKESSKGKGDGFYDAKMSGPPLLPSPTLQFSGSQGLLPPPVAAPLSSQPHQLPVDQNATQPQQHTSLRAHQLRQRNKQYIQQPKPQSHVSEEELPAPVKVAPNVEPRSKSTDGVLPEAMQTQLISIQEVGSNAVPSSGTNEGSVALRRRKNNRFGRNKNRPDGPVNVIESESATVGSDSSSGDTSRDLKQQGKGLGGKAPSNAGAIDDNVKTSPILKFDFSAPDLSQEIAFGSVQEAIDIDIGVSRPNDDMLNKRVQRKSQSVRRPFRERAAQDPRMIEKSLANEGMVWAPVRSLSSQGVTGSEVTSNKAEGESLQEIKNRNHEASSQNSLRSRRADLERYTPKPAVKSQVQTIQTQLQSTASADQPLNQPHRSTFQGELEIHAPDTSLYQSNTSLVSNEKKQGNDNRSNETARVGRFHSSWRQRIPSENIGAKEISGGGESRSLQLSLEAPKQKHLDAPNVLPGSDQRLQNVQLHLRPSSTQQMRQRNQLHETETDQQHIHKHSSQDFQAENQILEENTPSNQGARSLRPKLIKQNLQHDQHKDEQQHRSTDDNVTFQHSVAGRQDLTVTSYERERRNFHDKWEAHRRPRSAGSHVLRTQGSVDGKDSSSSGFATQSIRKTSLTSSSKGHPISSSEQEQIGQAHQPSSQHQEQSYGLKDQSLIDSSKKDQGISPQRQWGKSHALCSDGVDASQSMLVPQQHHRNGQMNRQQGFSAIEREQQKDRGNAAPIPQRKQGPVHLQWQQTASGRTDRSMSIEESTAIKTTEASTLVDVQKHQTSSLSKLRESVQPAPHYSSRNETSKVRPLSGEVQKQSQLHVQSGQVSKQQQQSFTLPATGQRSDATQGYSPQTNTQRTGDRGDGFYFRPRDHGPSRRGRFNGRFSGGRGSDMERMEQLQKRRLVVDATVDPVPSQVLG